MVDSSLLSTPGVHEQKLRQLFGDAAHFRGDAPVFDTPLFLLAFSNRSGSNLLANHLRTTPCFGGFHEQLNAQTVETQMQADARIESFPDYMRLMPERFGKRCKVYGYKATWDQIMMILRFGIDRMYTGLRILHITRADMLEQAISYHIALQTKQWTSAQEGEPVEPVYDGARISMLLEDAARSEVAVRQICASFGLSRFDVRYEMVTRAPEKVVRRIANFAELDLGDWQPSQPPILKQASKINRQFHRRYVAETNAALLGRGT